MRSTHAHPNSDRAYARFANGHPNSGTVNSDADPRANVATPRAYSNAATLHAYGAATIPYPNGYYSATVPDSDVAAPHPNQNTSSGNANSYTYGHTSPGHCNSDSAFTDSH